MSLIATSDRCCGSGGCVSTISATMMQQIVGAMQFEQSSRLVQVANAVNVKLDRRDDAKGLRGARQLMDWAC